MPMACNGIFVCRVWLIIFSSWFIFARSFTTDTLNQGHVLNATDRLVSENGLFTLGFSGSYLVINYTAGIADQVINHPLWLANRYTPILENSGVLTLDNTTGTLKIEHKDGKPIELYVGSGSITNVTAILQNDGNFVVKQVNSSGGQGRVLWESFDYPTDTLLPGMKLGISNKTKRLLRSWQAEDNPKPGNFTLEWDPDQRQIILRRGGFVFWTSGVLTPDNRFDSFVDLDEYNQNYNFSSVSNKDEKYFFYKLYVDKWIIPERRNVSRWFLDYKGNVYDDTSRPYIVSAEACDGYNEKYGCKKWEGPKCRKDGDKFAYRAGYFTDSYKWHQNRSFVECQALCWEDCACTGFKSYSDGTCHLFAGTFNNKDLRGGEQSYYIIIPGPPEDKTWIWITTSISIALLAVSAGVFLYLRWRRLKLEEKFLKELMTDDRARDVDELKNNGNGGYNLQIYNVATIKSATNGFSPANKLGAGGFGPVYKGRLSEGQEIAVKRLSSGSGQGLVEFKNELILIAKLQHMNLVRLLGFCIQGEEKMLVYEFMHNKSLDYFIFGDKPRREVLCWSRRFNIIEGIAQGMLYLHKYSRLKIIHRDLKASNILLDKNMNSKISDFGLARIFRQNELEANTCTLVGTRGYMSPEYLMKGVISTKSDVYSFGVLVLEIVSGKKNHNVYHYDRPLNLVGYAWESWKENSWAEILEPTLRFSAAEEEQVLRCINVGLLCVEQSPMDRPTMSDVLFMLTSDQPLPMPKQPAFYVGEHNLTTNPSKKNTKIESINGISITEMNGR